MHEPQLRPEEILRALQRLPPAPRYVVAYSTGPDSTALLDCLARTREQLPGSLAAAHIHHGLNRRADQWAELAERECARRDIPLAVLRVSVHDTGEGIEAAARQARYAALEQCLGDGHALLTGQHADDQAETILLQLLRASGPRGLAGMPEERALGCGRLLRTLLGWRKAALIEYCQRRRLDYTVDPQNEAPEHDRNWLRHEILPRLQSRWPRTVENLGISARLLGESETLLHAATERWLEQVTASGKDILELARLRALEPPVQRRVVRLAIEHLQLPQPPRRQLEELLRQAAAAAGDRSPVIEWQGGIARIHDSRLYLQGDWHAPAIQPADWRPPADWYQPGIGRLRLEPADDQSQPRSHDWPVLRVRGRCGGERIDLGGQRRAVKELMREARLPPWQREALPLVYAGERLVAVADFWLDHAFSKRLQGSGLRLRWLPITPADRPSRG